MLTDQQFIPTTGSCPFGALSENYILHSSPIHTPRGYTMLRTPHRPLNFKWKYLVSTNRHIPQRSWAQKRTRKKISKDYKENRTGKRRNEEQGMMKKIHKTKNRLMVAFDSNKWPNLRVVK